MIQLRTVTVGEHEVFYREAGDPDDPTLLLLHGFPSSSHMFRSLMPLLSDRFHLVAPDLPGFGFTRSPTRDHFDYTFDNLARVTAAFTDRLRLDRYGIYMFDYGAPVGMRLALARPDRITSIVSQNGNAYEEGLSDEWEPIRRYWAEPSEGNREALRPLLTPEATRWQYTHGAPDERMVAPEAYTLDAALLARPGNDDVQLDLLLDYATNLKLYPAFQRFLSARRPPLLAAWGKHDPFFLPEGALAFRRDVPGAQIRFYDTGHFALETHMIEIAAGLRSFLLEVALDEVVIGLQP